MSDKDIYHPEFLTTPADRDLPEPYSFARFCASNEKLCLSRNDYRKRFKTDDDREMELIGLRADWRDYPLVALDTRSAQVMAVGRGYLPMVRIAPVRQQRTPDHALVIEELAGQRGDFALFPPDVLEPATWERRFQSALAASDYTPAESGDVAYHHESSAQGGDYYLIVEERHTAGDIRAARDYLRQLRDVANLWIVSLPLVRLDAAMRINAANPTPLPAAAEKSPRASALK